MIPAPHSVAPETPLDEVVTTMPGQRYGSAFVVERGHVIGVFTSTDAIDALEELLRRRSDRD